MRHVKYSLRALLLFTTTVACFLALDGVAWPRYANVQFGRPLPGVCLRQPYVVRFGWPLTSRTDRLADHPPHSAGDGIFESSYHVSGLAVNALVAVLLAATMTAAIVYLPPFMAWQRYLRRERQMIDRKTAFR